MMKYSLQKMRDKRILVLSKWQLFWHYSIILLFLIPPVMNLIDLFQFYVTHTYNGVRSIGEMARWSYLPLIPAIAFYLIQKKRLKFEILEVSVAADIFIKSASQTAKQLEWEIIEQTSQIIVAKSRFSWRSWGELITIIREKDYILVNSICDPDNRPSVASWGMNSINKKTFEYYIRLNAPNIGLPQYGLEK